MGTLSDRGSKLYQILVGKSNKRERYRLFDWEPLLDSLISLYDVCCSIEAQRKDRNVADFVRKFKPSIDEIRSLMVNRNDFNIVKTIGRGHFGEVYVVKEKGTNNVYAMKILKKASTLQNNNMAFYEEERDIMAFANSPWVTSLHYAFQDIENLYLVMEFHPGGDLLTLLQRYDDCIMEEDDARFYLSEITMAVHAVHVIGYVHRDVKPENILIDITGHLKLADFGSSARLVNKKSVLCKMPVGTPEYIAPEVLQSMNSGGGIYGCECDWWSVGVVAYEMICGCVPFEADGVLQLYSQIMNFKSALEFPDDVTLKDSSKSMITMLLEEQKKRAGYNELAQHDFFKDMDWTTLKNTRPPFIPNIKSSEDTSNFGDFKSSLLGLNKKAEPTIANTLPFIGFTYTKNISSLSSIEARTRIKSIHQSSGQASVSDDLSQPTEKKDQSIVQQPSDKQSLSTIETLKQKLVETQISYENLQKKVNQTTDCNAKKDQEIAELEAKLSKVQCECQRMTRQLESMTEITNENERSKMLVNEMKTQVEKDKEVFSEMSAERKALTDKIAELSSRLDEMKQERSNSDAHWKEYDANQVKMQADMKLQIQQLQKVIDVKEVEYQERLNSSFSEIKRYRDLAEDLERKLNLQPEGRPDEGRKESEESSHNELSDLKDKLEETLFKYETIKKQLSSLQDVLKTTESDLSEKSISLLMVNQGLKTAETQNEDLQKQLDKAESLVASKDRQFDDLKSQMEKLEKELSSLKSLNEEKDAKIKAIAETLKNAEKTVSELGEQLNAQEERHSLVITQVTLKLNKRISDLEEVESKSSAEIEHFKNVVSTQKVSNFSLSQQLEESQFKIKSLEGENEEINANIQRINLSHNEQVFKLEATISQQNKLINFLHSDMKTKKKGGRAPKNDDDEKYKHVDATMNSQTRKTRDTEQQLALERMQTLRLNNELMKVKEELRLLKGEVSASHTNLASESARQRSLSASSVTSSVKGLRASCTSINTGDTASKVGHNFEVSVCYAPNTCFVCLLPVPSGRVVCKCSHCSFMCHTTCEAMAPSFDCRSLGQKSELVPVLHRSLLRNVFNGFDMFPESTPCSGALSVPHKVGPNKYDWQKRHFELNDTHLTISNKMSSTELEVVGSVYYANMKYRWKIHPAVHTSDIMFTPLSNAPFVFGLELTASEADNFKLSMSGLTQDKTLTSSSNTILYMLAATLDEKRFWVNQFENCRFPLASGADSPPLREPFLSLDWKKYHTIRVAVSLKDMTLIATPIGIFGFTVPDGEVVTCLADNNVHDLVHHDGHMFGLVGNNRQLVKFVIEKTKNVKKLTPKKYQLSFVPVSNVTDCHKIHSLHLDADHANVVASQSEGIMLIKMQLDNNSVRISKILCSSIPVSLVAQPTQIIVAQDKFCVYNTNSGDCKEFLDDADHSIAFIKYGSSVDNNFPMGVFEFARTSGSRIDYLICCSEFGLVLDAKGRRVSGGDLRWEQIPLSFHFVNLVLYICYPEMIEMRTFRNHSSTDLNLDTTAVFRHVNCPQFLGFCSGNDGILISTVGDNYVISVHRVRPQDLPVSTSASNPGLVRRKDLQATSSSGEVEKKSKPRYSIFRRVKRA